MSQIIHKPWGWEEIWAHTEMYIAKRLFINENNKIPPNSENKEKTISVILGTLILEVNTIMNNGDSQFALHYINKDSSFHIPAGMKYRMTAGDKDVTLIEVSTPDLE
jgi:hypothetical protein